MYTKTRGNTEIHRDEVVLFEVSSLFVVLKCRWRQESAGAGNEVPCSPLQLYNLEKHVSSVTSKRVYTFSKLQL